MDFHARAAVEHPDAEPVAVANWREPSLAKFADRHGIQRTTTDWRVLATDPGVDAAVIGTPNALHAEFVDAVLAGRQPRPSGADGRVVMQVVEQAYASPAGPAR